MSIDIDHDELTALTEDVFQALDNVADIDSPGVARLALTSISMLRYVENVIVDIASKDLDTMEELRNKQRAELAAAQANEARVAEALDVALRSLVDIAKSVCNLKKVVGGFARKLEAREPIAEELDAKIRIARETEASMRDRLQEPVDIPSVEYVAALQLVVWPALLTADRSSPS
ncbi:hypothetical protein D6C86_10426 [Aureobasidium pullulans]|uniref:Uncharacterized protein n=1 Tax=Aureobasidium pullulans TaxID=5580 RepID=A0A4S9UA33_AURPU|nr:hypothetical protein D6C94_10695 [Aureobasidium pullulans]THZ34994.1 hypothetical protein D6C87_10105 [Aureobasidium pullulans]THZ51730.1 hypothetical protein D6C86_10426 [Aureobasidium pullulans]THZ78731.1 hypothetical protein D6C88_06642 [Aureobasidium pullulans]